MTKNNNINVYQNSYKMTTPENTTCGNCPTELHQGEGHHNGEKILCDQCNAVATGDYRHPSLLWSPIEINGVIYELCKLQSNPYTTIHNTETKQIVGKWHTTGYEFIEPEKQPKMAPPKPLSPPPSPLGPQ